MDADKRHQLKQNELAEALAKLRDFNDPRFRYLLAAVGVVVVVVLAWYGWRYTHRQALERGWQRLSTSAAALLSQDSGRIVGAEKDLRDLMQESSDPGLTGYARLELATAKMRQAFTDPTQRTIAFEDARTLLEQIRSTPQTPPMLQAGATFALASACESLREFDKARALYKSLIDDTRFQGFAYGKLAEERLKTLDALSERVAFTQGEPPAPASQPGLTTLKTPEATDAALQQLLSNQPQGQTPPPIVRPVQPVQPTTTQPAQPAPAAPPPANPPPAPSEAP